MKTKLEMAHDYLRDIVSNWEYDDSFDPVAEAWRYADAMQAEADKREKQKAKDDAKSSKVILEKLADSRSLTKDEHGNCLHFHREFGHKKCMDCGASLEKWQPDWSQAPKNMNYFFVNKDGSKFWTINEPDKPNLTEHVMNFSDCGGDCYAYASLQDYQGDWRNSLRKRHE